MNPYPSCTIVVIKDKHVIYGSAVLVGCLPAVDKVPWPATNRSLLHFTHPLPLGFHGISRLYGVQARAQEITGNDVALLS